MEPELNGWCTDPWGRHEARWVSAGVPTKLVRDGDAESYDEPPDEPYSAPPAAIPSRDPDVPGDGGSSHYKARYEEGDLTSRQRHPIVDFFLRLPFP